jgi:bifunctional DNase/RNase
MQEMVIYGVSFDMVGKQPIVLLKTADGNRFLPIWIGHPEAAAILVKLQNAAQARPMTHDLLNDVVGQLDAEVISIAVTEMRENTYYARITIQQNGSEIEIDSRPSDAIALAVRSGAKIFAADDVIDESGIEFEGESVQGEEVAGVTPLAELDPDEFRRFLDSVTPDEFASGED